MLFVSNSVKSTEDQNSPYGEGLGIALAWEFSKLAFYVRQRYVAGQYSCQPTLLLVISFLGKKVLCAYAQH